MVLSQLAPRVPQVVEALTSPALPQRGSTRTAAAPAGKDCQALTRAEIARQTGAKVVVEQARAGDSCAWWLSKPRYSSDRADVTLSTGVSVRVSLSATGSTESRIDMQPGEVTAWLPAGTSLPGWRSGSKAAQAFSVSLRFSNPAGTRRTTTRATEAAAERTVTRLAEQAAIAMARRASTR